MTETHVHIAIRHLTKRFGSVTAVRDVSLEIPRGSFTTLLGPSGCGKTTILRTLAGFYDADEGDLYIGGRRVNDIPSHRRNAAMVFQDYALFPHMTVFENVSYGLKIAGLRGEALRQKVEKVLQDLGLQGLGERMPGMISGGQQQRVALARVLVMEPEVLLLDEPLSNLDAKLRISIRAELRLIQQRVGITTVYVTHDQEEALSISDRIAVMHQGEVVQYGTPWEIYYTPAKEFVADFVGIANFIRGRIQDVGAGQSRLDFGGVPIVVEAAGKAVAGRAGGRPEYPARGDRTQHHGAGGAWCEPSGGQDPHPHVRGAVGPLLGRRPPAGRHAPAGIHRGRAGSSRARDPGRTSLPPARSAEAAPPGKRDGCAAAPESAAVTGSSCPPSSRIRPRCHSSNPKSPNRFWPTLESGLQAHSPPAGVPGAIIPATGLVAA